MKNVLKTSAGVLALLAGSSFAIAQDSGTGTAGNQQMAGDVSCAQIVTLDAGEAERVLYFLAGHEAGQNESPGAGTSASTGMDTSTDTMAGTDAGSGSTTDMDDSDTTAATRTSPNMGTDTTTGTDTDTDTMAGATDTGTDTTAGTTGTDTDTTAGTTGTGTDTMAGTSGTDTTGGASADMGSDTMAADDTGTGTTTGTDATTTAGTTSGTTGSASGASAQQFATVGFFEIPVNSVITACEDAPDTSISEILRQQRGGTNQ